MGVKRAAEREDAADAEDTDRTELVQLLLKAFVDARRFWTTHVTDPVRGILQELLHGYPELGPNRVAETRASLVRGLEDFVRTVYAGRPEAEVAEALAQAKAGTWLATRADPKPRLQRRRSSWHGRTTALRLPPPPLPACLRRRRRLGGVRLCRCLAASGGRGATPRHYGISRRPAAALLDPTMP